MTNRNKLLALALVAKPPAQTTKLNALSLGGLSEAEMRIAMVIFDETERQREGKRATGGKLPAGLLGDSIDYVDTLPWDDLLLSPEVVRKCTERLKITPIELLNVAISKCHPSNWQALFWMREWFDQIHRNAVEDIAEARKEFEDLHAKKQIEENRAKAKAMADARHNKPGGAREKRAAIRAIWASGKYSSRTICAEQECGTLGMSYDTARRALRNTPHPVKG